MNAKKYIQYASLGLFNTALAMPVWAQNASLQAVIGLNQSQIVEQQLHKGKTSLPISNSSLLPLDAEFSSFSFPLENTNSQWQKQLNRVVKVEHKQRNLTLQGTLTQVTANLFELTNNTTSSLLPQNDFYLLAVETNATDPQQNTYSGAVSYQTNALTWQPKLSILLTNRAVTLIEQALITNHSSQSIALQEPVLHHANIGQPFAVAKTERFFSAASDSLSVDYSDNEITIPLVDRTITIAALSQTLIPLQQQSLVITAHKHQARINTYPQFLGQQAIPFTQQIEAVLKHDTLPGQYQTYWLRNELLLPSNPVTLDTMRQDAKIHISPNKSQDVTAQLTLVNATSQTLPMTQTWQLEINNHANEIREYQIEHRMNGIITQVKGDPSTPSGVDARWFEGKLPAKGSVTLHYSVVLGE